MATKSPSTARTTVKKFPELQFKVTANVGFGEEVVLCGSCAALGNFVPEHGIRLCTSSVDYPVWTSDIVVVPNADLEYKYCVFRNGKFNRWETVLKNRIIKSLPPNQGPFGFNDKLDEDPKPNRPSIRIGARVQTGSTPRKGVAFELPGSEDYTVDLDDRAECSSVAFHTSDQGRTRADSGQKFTSPRRRTSSHMDEDVTLTGQDGVVVVSYFLPVDVCKSEDGQWKVEWNCDSLLSLNTTLRVTRVGTVYLGQHLSTLTDADREIIEKKLQEISCFPVWLDADLAEQFYSGFCKGVLWPVFHHVVDIYGDLAIKFWEAKTINDLWLAYMSVNQKFGKKIVEHYNDRDLVWIHGFHLLLVPSFLSRMLQVAKVGLFLHTPFPSSEIFRTLPFREELLRGMLVADQIGFHVYEYSRHFLTACVRLLGLNHECNSAGFTEVTYNGRQVAIISIHAGVDPATIEDVLKIDSVQADIVSLKERFKDKFVFTGLDKIERLKGLQLKLVAFEKFLAHHPEAVDKVVLYQSGFVAPELKSDYNNCASEVMDLVTTINSKYPCSDGSQVVQYEVGEELSMRERVARLATTDAFVVTSVRDGLNRYPLENVLVHSLQKSERPALNILSQFTTCTRVLFGGLSINPWKVEQVAEAFELAWQMSTEKRQKQLAKDVTWVKQHTTGYWALQVLTDLKRIHKKTDRAYVTNVGLGVGSRPLHMDPGFTTLDTNEVIKAYKPARQRLIFLDFGGTLQSEHATSKDAGKRAIHFAALAQNQHNQDPLPPATLNTLRELCEDPKNVVFVVSGKDRESLLTGLGSVEGLGLAAEHGLFFKWPRKGVAPGKSSPTPGAEPSSDNEQSYWETLFPVHDQSWRQITKNIMEIYVARTHGTFIEEKGCALIWQFRDADPEFGFMQSKELEDHLKGVLKTFSIDILRGGGGAMSDAYIEVRPQGLSKGAFLEYVLARLSGSISQSEFSNMQSDNNLQFALVLGDDASDEVAFSALHMYIQSLPPNQRFSYFSCTVGKKPTEAKSYVNDADEVLELIGSLAKVSSSVNRYHSYGDLTNLSITNQRPLFERNGSAPPVLQKSLALSRSVSTPAFVHTNMPKSVSMKEYFNGITEEGSDEEGEIFF